MEKIELTKIFTFDSAHYLPDYKGKCANLHGHTYRLEVSVKDFIQPDGFVVDFSKLKEIVQIVLEKWDHKLLNEQMECKPTCENMLIQFLEEIKLVDKELVNKISKIRLYETPTSYATLQIAS